MYSEIDVVIEGALDRSVVFEGDNWSYIDNQVEMFIDLQKDELSDLNVELFRVDHEHSLSFTGMDVCHCVQSIVDHSPIAKWGTEVVV